MIMKIYLLIASLLIFTTGFAQDFIGKKKIADGYYNSFDFYKAAAMYEQLLKSSPNDLELHLKLATIYDHLNDSQGAERCYFFLVNRKEVKPEYLLSYAQALSRNGKYDKALIYYQKYKDVRPQDTRGDSFSQAYKHMNQFYKDSASFHIKKAPFSTLADDFSPAYFGGTIIFSSDRSGFSMVRSTYNWTQTSYLDLYQATPGSKQANSFSKELNSAYHEGPVTFSKNQDTIIFTRSNYFESHLRKSTEGVNKLSLFQANWDKGQKKWINVHPLTLNSDEYSVQHPAISPNGKELYFASDMPGGYGAMDLYVSHAIKDANGENSWGVALNLGPAINSPGDDVFPFIDMEGNLWYASSSIPGLGGLDIFFAGKTAQSFSKTINPGYPMNTRFDDFGYITDNTGEAGYFSSNRNNGYADDDIYSITRAFKKKLLRVYDAKTGKNLPMVHLDITEHGAEPKIASNEFAGVLTLVLHPYKSYGFKAVSSKYKPGSLELTSDQLSPMDTIQIALEPEPELLPPVAEYRVGDIITLENILYDLDKSDIRHDASLILDKLLKVLTDHPNMTIELRSHTDSRAAAAYNLKLSDRRAKSAAAYLFSKGIAKDRIIGKGYGETMLLNKCSDGVSCTEAEHQVNRRTEFKVLKME
jgi:outer membrane protein OmpA-like peptidoglycan-associated protein